MNIHTNIHTSLLRCCCPSLGRANGCVSNGTDSKADRRLGGSFLAASTGVRDRKKPVMHMRVLSLCICLDAHQNELRVKRNGECFLL
jgi:hypothetical protein